MTPAELWLLIIGEVGFTAFVIYMIYDSVKKAGESRSWNKFDILCFALVYVLIGGGTSLGITVLYAMHTYYR
jgi:hypothetical protein